jgi:citrate synthase
LTNVDDRATLPVTGTDRGAVVTTTLATPGLEGLEVASTAVGDVRGQEGFFHYRQHDATELARSRSFEDVWALLLDGHVPTAAEAAAFAHEVAIARPLPDEVVAALPTIARASGADRLGALRTALSLACSAVELRPWADADERQRRAAGLQVAAWVPVLLAELEAAHAEVRAPWPRGAGTAAGYLAAVSGREPPTAHVTALDRYLTLTADHGFNASTFTARTVASTGADLGAAVVAALGALSGPLHGGAPRRALELLHAIGAPERAEDHVRALVRRGGRVMGFGHRVYRTEDPRAALLRETALELDAPLAELAIAVERSVTQVLAEEKPDRDLRVNVEFHAAVVLDAVGVPPELFTPTFAVSRTVGWIAHVLEQAGANRLVRPSARYVGPTPPVPVPVP